MKHRNLILKLLLGAYWLIAFTLTHIQLSSQVAPKPGMDKLYHLIGYSLLGFLLIAFLIAENRFSQKRMRQCLMILIFYSFVDEATQPLFGRDFEILDMLADGIGATLGVWGSQKIFPLKSIDQ